MSYDERFRVHDVRLHIHLNRVWWKHEKGFRLHSNSSSALYRLLGRPQLATLNILRWVKEGKRPDFQLWRAHDLDPGSGHTAYHRESLIDLYLHAKYHWNRRNLFVDRRTYAHLRPALLDRSTLSKSGSKNTHNLNHTATVHCLSVTSLWYIQMVEQIGPVFGIQATPDLSHFKQTWVSLKLTVFCQESCLKL